MLGTPVAPLFTIGNLDFQIVTALSTKAQHPLVTIDAPPNFRIIGGGAQVVWTPGQGGAGAFLTSMYPASPADDADLSGKAWTVASQDDDDKPFSHQIRGFAVCASISGGLPISDNDYRVVLNDTIGQGPVNHPSATASLPSNFMIVGGGVQTVPNLKQGQLLVASYPVKTNDKPPTWAWYGGSKDHLNADPSTIKTFAIGLSNDLLSQNQAAIIVKPPYTSLVPTHYPTAAVMSDFNVIGGGAVDNYNTGKGNMLVGSYPLTDAAQDPIQTWQAIGADHVDTDLSTITAYGIVVVSTQSSCPMSPNLVRWMNDKYLKNK